MSYDHYKYITEYQKKNYAQLSVKLPKELFIKFEEKIKKNDTKKAVVIKEMIEKYIEEN